MKLKLVLKISMVWFFVGLFIMVSAMAGATHLPIVLALVGAFTAVCLVVFIIAAVIAEAKRIK